MLRSTSMPRWRASTITRSYGYHAAAGYAAGSRASKWAGATGELACGAIADHSTVRRSRSTPRACSSSSVCSTVTVEA